MQLRTRAISLHSIDFKENSKIVSLFCEHGGKTAVMARGAKNPKSPLFGRFEPGFRLDAVISSKSGRAVQQLVSADLVAGVPDVWNPPGFGELLYNTLELSDQVLQEHQEHPDFFQFIWEFLSWSAARQEKPGMKYFPYIQWRICELSGLSMELSGDGNWFDIQVGSLTETDEMAFSYALSAWQKQYLEIIRTGRSALIEQLETQKNEIRHLVHLFDLYLNYHMDSLKPRKTGAVFAQLDV